MPANLSRFGTVLWPVLVLVVALVCVLRLEAARDGVEITRHAVGQTPVMRFARPGADGPVVVIAHGFAGSSQMMQGYALTLARAGYVVQAFDFLGHGRNPVPMSGDVTSVDGTTRLLVDETRRVIAATRREGEAVALLGHSMATDILVRVAAAEKGAVGPVVLLSAFSQEITETQPPDLLLVSGVGEPRLRAFALEAARMLDPAATEGQTVIAGDIRRRAAVAPMVEHVAILHSPTAAAEALAWIDAAYGRASTTGAVAMGGWMLGLLAALALLAAPLARLLPAAAPVPGPLPNRRQAALAMLLPAVLAPLVAVPLDPGLLPVLVADYLALHMGLFGLLQMLLLRRAGVALGPLVPLAVLGLLLWSLAVFGVAMDRYTASFWPTGPRIAIIAALALGAVPFMLGDALITRGAGPGRRIAARAAFLGSLGLAVALDFSGLFFLLLIAPVIVLFYLVFGTMGRAVARRSGAAAAGIGLGLTLAWALGVSFPLFSAGGVP